MKLRYLLFRHGEVWVAACMGLCLATQDIGLRAAESKLDEQVLSYIEEATTLDGGKHKQHLLNRPAPFTDRLSYYWCRFREAMGFPDSYARTKQKLYTGTQLLDITHAYLDPW